MIELKGFEMTGTRRLSFAHLIMGRHLAAGVNGNTDGFYHERALGDPRERGLYHSPIGMKDSNQQ